VHLLGVTVLLLILSLHVACAVLLWFSFACCFPVSSVGHTWSLPPLLRTAAQMLLCVEAVHC
jgi:hypothetical protein